MHKIKISIEHNPEFSFENISKAKDIVELSVDKIKELYNMGFIVVYEF